jgi:preprotein translocase subunit SecE
MSAEQIGEQKPRRRRRRSKQQEIEETPEVDDEEERGLAKAKGRATRSRRREVDEEKSGNFLSRAREYLEGVQTEVQKVVWPTRQETRRLTVIVIIALVLASIALGTVSALFTELFRIGLNNPIILLVFMVLALGAGFAFTRMNSRNAAR